MNKCLSILTAVLVFLFTQQAYCGSYGGGLGTAAEPHLISTAEQMQEIGANPTDWDKHFILTADIDLSAYTGMSYNIIGNETTSFSGVFDGNGHVISNLTIDIAGVRHDYLGLFGYIEGYNAELKNIGVENVNITGNVDVDGNRYVGCLVGYNLAPVTNCYATGTVTGGNHTGGLVGENLGTISNCNSTSTVTGGSFSGGLVGLNHIDCQIENSFATGTVSGSGRIGGLVGYNKGMVTNSHATGSVSSGTNWQDHIGGLVGENNDNGQIVNSYATGEVSGDQYIGGLTGLNRNVISGCFSTGTVTGNQDVGGLTGANSYRDALIIDCYSTSAVTGDENIGGLVGDGSNDSRLTSCYATGAVQGRKNVGGLTGGNSVILNCYAMGSVTGDEFVGGLTGRGSKLTNCYATGVVQGIENVGGLSGGISGIAANCFWDINTSGISDGGGGTGLSTLLMQGMLLWGNNGYAGTEWTINNGNDYPRLAWENTGDPLIVQLTLSLDGSGTEEDPYQIQTSDELQQLTLTSSIWNSCFVLTSDIDLAGLQVLAIGSPDTPFTGVFNGNGYVINNLTIDTGGANYDYLALFGKVDFDAEVINLGVENANITGGQHSGYIAGLIGYNNGSITNCYSIGDIAGGGNIGGLVGYNRGSMTDCYAVGSVRGGGNVGGLVGGSTGVHVSQCRITNCRADVNVSGSNIGGGNDEFGGLVGWNQNGEITDCHATGTVVGRNYIGGLVGKSENYGYITNCYATGTVVGGDYVGGLIGYTKDRITNCYAVGSVHGSASVGGLIGYNDNQSRITNCYAMGSVYGDRRVGGLTGYNYQGRITDCYATGVVNGRRYIGGLTGFDYNGTYYSSFWNSDINPELTGVGSGIDPVDVIGRTTLEMQTQSTFTSYGWDFVGETANGTEDIWYTTGCSYPLLSWQPVGMVPDVTGLSQADAVNTVKLAGLHVVIRKIYSDAVPSGYIISQVPSVGCEAATVEIVVSRGCPYGAGSGTEADPYQIWTAEQMNSIGVDPNDWDKQFILMADIDLSVYTGTSFNVIGNSTELFWGVFDGNGHKISNFTHTSSDKKYIGLFGHLSTDSQISNLGLIDVNIDAANSEYVGGLAGYNSYGIITNCYVTGSINGHGNYVGGLTGMNKGTIANSYATGSVSGNSVVGGLVGYNDYGSISNCYATGTATGHENIGGLVGYNKKGSISNCYATGTATGHENIGGLVGNGHDGSVDKCYAAVTVTGDRDVGGLVGNNRYGVILNSFWDIAYTAVSNGGRGLLASQMQNMLLYSLNGWGGSVWTINDGQGFPRLAWENAGDPLIPEMPIPFTGSGTVQDPYQLKTPDDLLMLAFGQPLCDKHFILTNSIDLSGIDMCPIGFSRNHFTGTFDGNSHVINNLKLNYSDLLSVGFFGFVGQNGQVINLGLANVDILGGNDVGGLAGNSSNAVFTNCFVTGKVSGNNYIGGMVGRCTRTSVSQCYSSSTISCLDVYAGGLIGESRNDATYIMCYSTGSVSGHAGIGGLIGRSLQNSSVTNCYSTCAVIGDHLLGGLIADRQHDGPITNSFWDINVSGTTSSDGGTGKTTVQMQQIDTFITAGWDFEGVWYMETYPRLQWQLNPLQTRIDAAVDGDIITVEPGVYVGPLFFRGKNVTLVSTDPTDPDVVAATVLDGGGLGAVVTFDGSEDESCVLDGFTITGGNNNTFGGGVFGNGCLATLTNCVIEGNQVVGAPGGGVWGLNGLIENCIIRENSAVSGSGLTKCSGVIRNCLIVGNLDGTLRKCNGTIINCTIVGSPGDLAASVKGCKGVFENCILQPGAGDLFINSSATLRYCCYPDTAGEGNIDDDPLFVNAAEGNYHLLPNSQCIDAGDPASDYSNEPSPNGDRVNIGAYGNTSEAARSRDGLIMLGFEVVNKVRVGRTAFEYELSMIMRNTNDYDVSDLQMRLIVADDAVLSVADDEVLIGEIMAGEVKISIDTFKLTIDRSSAIDTDRLTWELIYYVSVLGSQSQQSMAIISLAAVDPRPGDITGEGDINLRDFAVLASQWQQLPGVPSADIALPLDGYVGIEDLLYLAEHWLGGSE